MIVPLHWILLKKSIAPSISSLCGRNLLVKALKLWPWAVYWLSSSQWIENNENHPGERRLVEYSGGNYKILATVWSVLASPIRLAAWELRIWAGNLTCWFVMYREKLREFKCSPYWGTAFHGLAVMDHEIISISIKNLPATRYFTKLGMKLPDIRRTRDCEFLEKITKSDDSNPWRDAITPCPEGPCVTASYRHTSFRVNQSSIYNWAKAYTQSV